MRHSTDRILTTHAGSLPRPDALREAWAKPGTSDAEIDALLKSAVADVVKAQQAVAVDIPNDGEFGKPMRAATDLAAWGTYIFGRLSGFGPTPAGAAAPDRAQARPADAHRRRALGAARIRRFLCARRGRAEHRLPPRLHRRRSPIPAKRR